MVRRFGLYYAILSGVLIVGLLLLIVVRLNSSRATAIEDATASYRRVETDLRTALDTGSDPARLLREYIARVPTVDAVVLYDPNVGIRYVWTTDARLLRLSDRNLAEVRGFPQYDLSEITQFTVRNRVSAASPIYLDVVYRLLRFTDVYAPLRDALIVLLAFGFVSILLLVVSDARLRASDAGTGHRPAASKRSAAASPTAASTEPDTEPAAPFAPETKIEPQTRLAPEPKIESEPKIKAEPVPEPALEEVDLDEIATDPGEPGTMINPVSGLSYREHLERKLSLELERAAYHDQDLSVLLVAFDGPHTPELHSDRASLILRTFTFEDLCFDFEDKTFCVILTNTDLTQAIRSAGDFRAASGASAIGISARNGRLVEASRIIKEAQRSLDHARSERSGIVGFRPDARKYRQFLSEHRDAG